MLRVSILCIHSANRSSNVNRWNIIVIVVVVEKRLQYFVVFFIVLCCAALACVLLLFIFCRCSYFAFQIKSTSESGRHAVFQESENPYMVVSALTMVFNGKLNRTEQKTALHKLFKTFERLVFFSAFVVERMQLQIMLQWLRATATYKTRTPYTYKCAVA